MATIIDSLMVTLGMDRSEFKKGAKEVADTQESLTKKLTKDSKDRQEVDRKMSDAEKKRAKDLQENSKKSAESIRQIRNQAIGLLALFTGGIGLARFTSDTISTAASVGRLSSNIGESIQTIVGWQRAFENVGGTADEATESLTKASNAIGAFKSGRSSPEIQGFLQMGGSIDNGELDSANSFLMAQSALIQKVIKERGTAVAMYQAQSFLGVGANEFNLLKQGPQAVGSQVSTLGAGSGMNSKSAAAAAALQVRFNQLKHTFEDVSRTVLLNLIPVFDRLLTYFQKFASWIQSHQGDIVKFLDKGVDMLVTFGKEADEIAKKLGGWDKILMAIAAIKLAGLVSQLTSVLGLVSAIIIAAGVLDSSANEGAEKAATTPGGKIDGGDIASMFKQKWLELKSIFGSEHSEELLKSMSKMGNKNVKVYDKSTPIFDNFGASQSSPARRAASAAAGNMMSTDYNIDTINIVTQAKDAEGIAKTIRPAIEKRSYVPQANSGVN